MPKCEIIVNIDGIVTSKIFNSEKELDCWLYDNQDSLSVYNDPKTGLITFSLNEKEATKQRLITDQKKWKILGEKSIPKANNPNSIEEASLGVTLAMNFAGNKIAMDKPVSTYNEDEIKRRFFASHESMYETQGESSETAKILTIKDWDLYKKENDTINKIGSGAHAILEDILKNQYSSFKNPQYSILSGNSLAVKKISDTIAYQIKDAIKNRFANISFENDIFTEIDVYSKEISSEYKQIIQGLKEAKTTIDKLSKDDNQLNKKSALNLESILSGSDFNLHGKIDMIIIDENGYINLYDFKFSKESFDNWHQSKKDAAEMQLQLYAAMLRQAGYKVGEIGIIPIKVTLDINNLENNQYELTGKTFETIVKPCSDFSTKTMADLIIPNNVKIDLSSLNEVNKKIGELFPGKNLDEVSKKTELDIEYFRANLCKEVTSNDKEYNPNILQWYFYDKISRLERGGKSQKVFFTKDNAHEVISNYLKKYNEYKANINVNIGKKFKEISKMKEGKHLSLLNFFRSLSFNKDVIDGNMNLFYPFFINGWNLVGDVDNAEALWANGFYLFEKDNVVQIIYMDATRNLGRKMKINDQTSIFGNTKLDSQIDKTIDLESTYANLLTMKVMCYISDTSYFDNKRVLGITIKNFDEVPIFKISNNLLIKNWNKLVFENRQIKSLHTIDERKMLDDVSASLFMANQWMLTINGGNELATQIKSIAAYKDSLSKAIVNIEIIFNKLKEKYFYSVPLTEVTGDQINSPAYKAIVSLAQSLLSLKNIYLINETDVGKIWDPESFALGTNFSPLFMSKSSNLRSLDKLSSAYFDTIANIFREKALSWQNLMKNVIEEWKNHPELHYSENIGGEFKVFNQWFRRDPMDESKIDKNLILKDPNDSYFDNLPESKKLLTYFLEQLNIMRYGDKEKSANAKAFNEEEWYSVPLMRSGTSEQMSKIKNLKDIYKTISAWWKRKTETGLEGYDDAEIEKEMIKQLNDLDADKLKNVYFQINADKRQELLDKQGNIYETNLDAIFLRTLSEDSKVKASEIFLPMFTAYRVLLYYNSLVNHQPAQQIIETANDFIKRKIFRQNIIDTKLQGISMFAGMLRSIVSKLTLGINLKNFVRDYFVGYIDNAKETFLKSGDKVFPVLANTLSERRKYFEYYKNSLAKIASDTFKMNDVMSEIQQLNAMYRMVDYDQRKMAQTAKTNRFAPLNLTSDFIYVTSNLSDYYHRNAILIAALKYIGAWEAHQINSETGELEYDMSKDERYKILFDYNFDISKVPYEEIDKFKKAENEYTISLNEWNSSGENYKIGDKFKLALSPHESENIRVFSDLMFGCYDPQAKAMINEYFLGAMFLQFKTYTLNQIIKYTRAGGAVNIHHPTNIIDEETGEEYFDVVTTTPEDYQKYGAMKRVKRSEISIEDIKSGRAKPAMDYSGAYMNGIGRTILKIPGIIMKWDQEELEKYWNQPHVRANILGSLWDNLFMLLLSLLVKQMYGSDTITNLDDQTWFTQWSYGVLTGITKNGLIWEIANSMYGNGTIPMIGSLKRYYSTVQNVIFGNTNVLYAFTNTIGATREFSYIFDTKE